MSNKFSFIYNIGESAILPEQIALYSAFIACLSPDEVCLMLDLHFLQKFSQRKAVLKVIGRDLQSCMMESHKNLISNLYQSIDTLPYQKKQSAVFCLTYLHDFLPEKMQEEIVHFLLNSKYKSIRRAGYKKLEKWRNSFNEIIELNWHTFSDFECAILLIKNFPVSYLESHLKPIQKVVLGTRYLHQLYIKVSEKNPSTLQELKLIDEITYAYVTVKINGRFDEEEAWSIYEHEKYSERLGLLIWCFGQMNLWSTLEKINEQIEKVVEERFLARRIELNKSLEKYCN